MELQDASLLRIFLSEDDLLNGHQLHIEILSKAHAMEIAGGTILRGVGGYRFTQRESRREANVQSGYRLLASG